MATRVNQLGALKLSFPVWWLGVLAIWLAAMIATPIAGWVFGEENFPTMATIGVLAQFSAVAISLAAVWHWQRLVITLTVVFVGTWGVEALGVATGFPFGHYHYTDLLQPQLGGVPLLIPLAWMMMLAPAWAVTSYVLNDWQPQNHLLRRVGFAIVAALAFTAWDLYLDPQMVDRNLWIWDESGAYFGIPLVNFLGWLAVSGTLSFVLAPDQLPRRFLLIIYLVTWIFQAIGLGIFWGQPGPAAVGFVAMGFFAVLAVRQELKAWTR
jgi:lycopene beta-cyclase